MKTSLLQLKKIDFILLIVLFSLSAFIMISIFPKGMGVDEALYWNEAKTISISHYYIGTIQKTPFHGPLFFYINYLTAHISDSLFALRFPAILFCFATILLLYLFAKIFFNLPTAFVASLLLTISPAFNAISIYMMPHIFYCFFSLAALMMYMLAMKTENGKYLILAFLFAALSLLTTILGVITIASIFLSLLFVKNPFLSIKHKKFSKYITYSVLAMLLLILIVSPMSLLKGYFIKNYRNAEDLIYNEKNLQKKNFFSFDLFIEILKNERPFLFFLILGIVSLFVIPFKNKILLPIVVYLLLYSFVMSFTAGIFTYAVPILLFIYAFASAFIFATIKKMNGKSLFFTFITLILLCLFAFYMVISLQDNKYYKPSPKYDLRYDNFYLSYEYIKNKNESNISVLTPGSYLFKYYAKKDGLNITFIEFPVVRFNFSKLPDFPDYVFYWNKPPLNSIDNESYTYTLMKKIESSCSNEVNITDVLIFNCKNISSMSPLRFT